jgi:hypothetical protein
MDQDYPMNYLKIILDCGWPNFFAACPKMGQFISKWSNFRPKAMNDFMVK